MKSIFEWVREGNPDYVKKKKREELEAELSGYEEQLGHIAGYRDQQQSVQRDARTPEDARIMDRLESRITELKNELEALEKPNS